MNKRELVSEKKKGLTISDVILIGVLLAAGAVLKFFVGSLFSAGHETELHHRDVLPDDPAHPAPPAGGCHYRPSGRRDLPILSRHALYQPGQ